MTNPLSYSMFLTWVKPPIYQKCPCFKCHSLMHFTVHSTSYTLFMCTCYVIGLYFLHSDLVAETTRSYTPPVTVVPVTMVQDCKKKMQNIIAGPYSNHSKPLWFRFRNVDGKCHRHYRRGLRMNGDPPPTQEFSHGLICVKVNVIKLFFN